MDTTAFWELIEASRREAAGRGGRLAWLLGELARRPVAEVANFQACLEEVADDAYTWELWAAGDRVFGGLCSDDGFFYFRLWLAGLGRAAFERALADPDSLADAPEIRRLGRRPAGAWGDDWPEWEELDYVAAEVFESQTGGRDPAAFHDLVEAAGGRRTAPDAEPVGVPWDVRDEDEAARRIPRLSALFPARHRRPGAP